MKHIIYIPFVFFLLIWAAMPAWAIHTVDTINVSTAQNVAINIDTSASIKENNQPAANLADYTLQVTPPPAAQGTTAVNGLSVTFTPARDVTGLVTFNISIVHTDTHTAAGVINVNILAADISETVTVISVKETPQESVATAMDTLCPGLQTNPNLVLTPEEQELLQRCDQLNSQIVAGQTAEVIAALQQIAPEEVAVQVRTGKTLSDRQMRNVGGRLAALRRGATGVSTNAFALQNAKDRIPGSVFNDWIHTAAGTNQVNSPWGLFLSGLVGNVERERTEQENGFEFQTLGTTIGVDYRVGKSFVLGGAFGFASSDVQIDKDTSEMDVSGFNITNYGTYYVSHSTYFDWVLTYSSHTYETLRKLDLFNANAFSETNGQLLGLSLSGSYDFVNVGGLALSVSGRVDYVDSTIDAYREFGAGALNMAIQEQTFTSLTSEIGFKATYAIGTGTGVLVPNLDINFSQQHEGDAVQITGQFVNDRFGTTFQFETDDPDREYLNVGLGLSAVFPGGNTVFIQAITTLDRESYNDYHVAIGSRFEF